ncbi:MAG: hypothetical protein LBB82_07020 [Treponema sp.]|jgi:HEAT repeat protein|nr:hypothetical protein [Treponema sp.]
MTRKTLMLLLVFVPAAGAFAQSPAYFESETRIERILDSYERRFIRSSLQAKADLLHDAALDDRAPEFFGPLCRFALDFVLENAALFPNDPDMANLAVRAVRGIGESGYSPAAPALWRIFLGFRDNVIRFEALAALPLLGSSEPVPDINRFLAEQNSLYGSSLAPDLTLLDGIIKTLGGIGDERSYPALFGACLIYPGESGENAAASLFAINERAGGLGAFFIQVVLQNPVREKYEALELAKRPESAVNYGDLAEAALEAALNQNLSGESVRRLRSDALRIIREEKIGRALPLVIKNYNQCLSAYRSNRDRGRPDYLEAVSALAAMENAEAAGLLTLQLDLVNSGMESSASCDESVVTALVNALGGLGYRAAHDSLARMDRLPYSDAVKTSAADARAKLQW